MSPRWSSVAEDVGQHGETLRLPDQPHGDAGHRVSQWHAGIISASEAPHTEAIDEEPFDSVNLGDDADRVGEAFLGRQQRRIERQASLPCRSPRVPASPFGQLRQSNTAESCNLA